MSFFIETLVGGSGVDNVTLGAQSTGSTIDLGAGNDTLNLFNAATNTVTIRIIRGFLKGTANEVRTMLHGPKTLIVQDYETAGHYHSHRLGVSTRKHCRIG